VLRKNQICDKLKAKARKVTGLWMPTSSSGSCGVGNGLRPRTRVAQSDLALTGSSFFKGLLLGAVGSIYACVLIQTLEISGPIITWQSMMTVLT
jgi:hypothetical protein